jgi:hypothetical protein
VIEGKPATPASDVFAWGCVVAYAGTGRAPFAAPTVPAVMYQIMHAEPTLDGIDPALRDVVERALAKDPARRPSAQELLDRLVGHDHADTAQIAENVRRTWPYRTRQDIAQTMPRPAGAPRTGSHIGRREKLATVALLAMLLVIAAVVVVVWRQSSNGPPSKTSSVYDDDFSNTSSGWSGSTWTSGSGYYQGGYRIDAGGVNGSRWEAAPYEQAMPERVLVTADARAIGGPDYGQFGVFCRAGEGTGEDATMYVFLVRVDGKGTLIRKLNGKSGSKELANKASAPGFKKGKQNHLQASCERQGGQVRLRFWLDGHLAATATDTDRPLPTGAAGLISAQTNGGSTGEVQVMYDNFHLAGITG